MQSGDTFFTPGGKIEYEVVGAVCRLFDRETLPYPHCLTRWRMKGAGWNRVGIRFCLDIATKNKESYAVRFQSEGESYEKVVTLWWLTLAPKEAKEWNAARKSNNSGETSKQNSPTKLS